MATRRLAVDPVPSRVVKEDVMRAIDRPCGHHIEAADDDEPFGVCREHVDRDHPEPERTDEQLRARIAADAHDVTSRAPA